MKYRSAVTYLLISIIIRCFVGRIGFMWMMVLKLVGWCKVILLYRTIRNEIFLASLPLLFFLILQTNNSYQRRSDICWRMLLVGLCNQYVIALELFRVRFCSDRLLLFYLDLKQNAKCAKHGISVTIWICRNLHRPFGLTPFRFLNKSLIRLSFSNRLGMNFAI